MQTRRTVHSRRTNELHWMLPLLLLPAIAQAQDYESVAHGVRIYNTSTSCGCMGSESKPCTEDAIFDTWTTTFTNRMTSTMAYDQRERFMNGAVDPADFVDVSRFPYGNDASDPGGTDFADVIFYTGHASHVCDSTQGYLFRFPMGQLHANQECWMRTDTFHAGPPVGDLGPTLNWNSDANVAIFFSCNSVQKCVWNGGGYDRMGTNQFNTLLGFHGYVLGSSTNNSRLDGYLSGTRDNGIGDDWVDELTQIKSGSNNDECATVIVFGSTRELRDNQYYNGGYRDLKATDTSRSSTFYFIPGCDPDGGEVL